MSARRSVKPARRIAACRVETLVEYDPALGALDDALSLGGWKRAEHAIVRRRADGKVSGRVVWRRAGESITWSARFTYEGAR